MKPLMVAMKGHPGTGKSTLAESVCKSLKWPLIDKDDALDCLTMIRDSKNLRKQLNAVSYDVMFRIAESQLRIGLGVVVVCPLAWPWLFKQCESIANRNGVQMVVIECICSDESLWKRRLEWRADSALGSSDSFAEHQGEDSKREEWADGLRSVFHVATDAWWHKPKEWEELKRNVGRYGDSCTYDMGSVKMLVVDTAAHDNSVESMRDLVLQWLKDIPL